MNTTDVSRQYISSYLLVRFSLVCLPFLFANCKKWVEVSPPLTSTASNSIYTTDATAASVLTGIYSEISEQDETQGGGYLTDISIDCALSADELTLYDVNNSTYQLFYINNLGSNTMGGQIWQSMYAILFQVNSAIAGLEASTSLTPAVKQQLLGESFFLRGYFYFYLTSLYGDVPLALTTNYQVNENLSRTARKDVYTQIIADLKQAQSLLSTNFLDATVQATTPMRLRPNKWVAEAMLAKTYLCSNDYSDAESLADSVIAQNSLFQLDAFNNVFLPTSMEALWQVQPVGTGSQSNTGEGAMFVLPSDGPNTSGLNPFYLSNSLVSSFEFGDLRKANWVDSVIVGTTVYYFPYKYKADATVTSTQEFIMMMRLAEVYLIRAEARARQNEIAGARSDINVVRMRAGLDTTAANSQTALLNAVIQERRVELFTEWGDRWFDLQRFGTIDATMDTVSIQKGGAWQAYKSLFPILSQEIILDKNLVQTPGYN